MTTKRLPRNFRQNLHAYDIDTLSRAYEIAQVRVFEAKPGTAAYTRWLNLAADIRNHVFERGFRFVRCLNCEEFDAWLKERY